MGLIELVKLFFSDDEEIVIPINDEEKEEYVCVLVEPELIIDTCSQPNYESDNMTELKELIGKLPSAPVGPAPKFELERNTL